MATVVDFDGARAAHHLHVMLDVPADLHQVLVPNLILQPLVENAIKHGIAKRVEGGRIEVIGRRAGDTLNLSGYNDGPGLPNERAAPQTGIGLSNLRSRLRILYGDRFDLNLRSPDTGGTEVAISLPLGPQQR